MSRSDVDLFCFSEYSSIEWELGKVHLADRNVKSFVARLGDVLNSTNADWLLFWDTSLDNPDTSVIEDLSKGKLDVYHAGLKLGSVRLPRVMDYVDPTWMYNIDGATNIEHTNFRLNFKACLIRVSALKKIGLPSREYSSMVMCGIAYGYLLMKKGAIVRYTPLLVEKLYKEEKNERDEWVFLRQFYAKKWQLWAVVNKSGLISNLKHWLSSRNIKAVDKSRCIHSSRKTSKGVVEKKVSILAPTLDRYSYLKEELRELNKQTILPFEVLITDQTDVERRQTIDFSVYDNISVKYFPQDDKGQCLAWNKLIEESTGEYVFFFGDDAYNIKPDFLEKMLQSIQRFDADMIASNVIEKGIVYGEQNYHYYSSDTFPITLIKKSVVDRAGRMNMFFNKQAKADHDLAMRCHLNGAVMIFDPSAEIGHHRAPAGGLRTHKARVVTNYMTKNTITKILNPTPSEIYIYKKYYSEKQYKSHIKIKYFNQLIVNGSLLKKTLRLGFFIVKLPSMITTYKKNKKLAMRALKEDGVL